MQTFITLPADLKAAQQCLGESGLLVKQRACGWRDHQQRPTQHAQKLTQMEDWIGATDRSE